MNDFIFNVFPSQGNAFYPPLAGSFLGVILGILANYLLKIYNDNKEKIKYKKMIKSEIEQCIRTLDQDSVQLLPTDRWISAVNSGALKFFEVDIELEPLSISYQRIKNYNQLITERVIAGQIVFGATWDEIGEFLSGNPPIRVQLSILVDDRETLKNELKNMSGAKWW